MSASPEAVRRLTVGDIAKLPADGQRIAGAAEADGKLRDDASFTIERLQPPVRFEYGNRCGFSNGLR